MNTLHMRTAVSALLLLGLALHPVPVRAQADETAATTGQRVLSGELVVSKVKKNAFRLVGHNGTFTAPAGTSLAALDGKPVEVEIGRDGRVVQITRKVIHIEPITHTVDVISGELQVRDAGHRTFSIAGDHHTYEAPPRIDLQTYAGRMVDVDLNERGQVKGIRLAARAGERPFTSTCPYDGQAYTAGASICDAGTRFRCEGGLWRNLGSACAADGPAASRPPHTCIVGDAGVAAGSSICRKGTTFRCVDGEWVNIQTACGY